MLIKLPFNPRFIPLAKSIISRALLSVAPDIKDYGTEKEHDTLYISKIIDTFIKDSNTADEFIDKLAWLLVYLEYDTSDIFHKRIQEEYYLPEILAELTASEKYPEALDDHLSDHLLEKNMPIIKNKVKYIKKDLNILYYQIQNPQENIKNLSHGQIFQIIQKDENWKNLCENKNDHNIVIEDDHSIIRYKDKDGKIYCLVINEVIEQIKTNINNVVNPTTGHKLNGRVFKKIYFII